MPDTIFHLRLDDKLGRKLEYLASETQRKKADVIRWLIRNGTPEMMGVPKSIQEKKPA